MISATGSSFLLAETCCRNEPVERLAFTFSPPQETDVVLLTAIVLCYSACGGTTAVFSFAALFEKLAGKEKEEDFAGDRALRFVAQDLGTSVSAAARPLTTPARAAHNLNYSVVIKGEL